MKMMSSYQYRLPNNTITSDHFKFSDEWMKEVKRLQIENDRLKKTVTFELPSYGITDSYDKFLTEWRAYYQKQRKEMNKLINEKENTRRRADNLELKFQEQKESYGDYITKLRRQIFALVIKDVLLGRIYKGPLTIVYDYLDIDWKPYF